VFVLHLPRVSHARVGVKHKNVRLKSGAIGFVHDAVEFDVHVGEFVLARVCLVELRREVVHVPTPEERIALVLRHKYYDPGYIIEVQQVCRVVKHIDLVGLHIQLDQIGQFFGPPAIQVLIPGRINLHILFKFMVLRSSFEVLNRDGLPELVPTFKTR